MNKGEKEINVRKERMSGKGRWSGDGERRRVERERDRKMW